MRKFKSMKAARAAYEKVERTCGMPFEQWLFEDILGDEKPLDDGDAAAAFLNHYVYKSRGHESFWVVPLDANHNPLCLPVTVSEGLLNGTPADAREVFRNAIWWNAAAIIVAHNHPSGSPTPSKKDIALTKALLAASAIIRIPLLDHIVLGDDTYISLREEGYVDFENPEKNPSLPYCNS